MLFFHKFKFKCYFLKSIRPCVVRRGDNLWLTVIGYSLKNCYLVISKVSGNQTDNVLMSQSVISKPIEKRGGTQKMPYAFTEQGVAMLSSVLRSPLAIQVNIGIQRTQA